MKVYVTDSGHQMDEDDFMQYLRFMKSAMKEQSVDQFIDIIWEKDFLETV